jgi:DNA-binding transcriptional MerR regulator
MVTQHNDKDLPLTATAAGAILGISGYGVRSLADRGRLAHTRDSSGRRLYRRSDCEQLKREREARATAAA